MVMSYKLPGEKPDYDENGRDSMGLTLEEGAAWLRKMHAVMEPRRREWRIERELKSFGLWKPSGPAS